jgi:hypothetical protein
VPLGSIDARVWNVGCAPAAVRTRLVADAALWRSHASKRSDMKCVDLRGRAEVLRSLLLADDAGCPNDFSVMLSWYPPDPDGLHNLIASPPSGRWKNGGRLVQLRIRTWVVFITTSSVPMPTDFRFLALTSGEPVPVISHSTPFRDGREFRDTVALMQRGTSAGRTRRR